MGVGAVLLQSSQVDEVGRAACEEASVRGDVRVDVFNVETEGVDAADFTVANVTGESRVGLESIQVVCGILLLSDPSCT